MRPDDAMAHTNLGTALRALDEKDQALEHFRRAVAIDPNLAPAQTNLGQLLLDLGRAEQLCLTASRPSTSSPTCRRRTTTWETRFGPSVGSPRPGRVMARRSGSGPSMAQAYVNLGQTLQQEGQWDEALPWLRRATEIEPGSLVFLALLAEAAVERELFDEAIACYQKDARDRLHAGGDPQCARMAVAGSRPARRVGRAPERNRLCLRPDFAIAHVNLGGIHEKLGDFAAAEDSFRAATRHTRSRVHRPWRGWPCCCAAACRTRTSR